MSLKNPNNVIHNVSFFNNRQPDGQAWYWHWRITRCLMDAAREPELHKFEFQGIFQHALRCFQDRAEKALSATQMLWGDHLLADGRLNYCFWKASHAC